jgi:hypothetical protein
MDVKEAIDELKYSRDMCYFDPSTGETGKPYSEEFERMAQALDIAIEALKNEFGEQSEQKTEDEKYHYYPKAEMKLKEILPLIRSAGYSNRDELGYSITLCPECEEWTWVKLNASSCLLDALGDLRVESIDAEDGNFKVWIITDDYNWFRSPEEKTGKWIHVNKLWYKCSECDTHREMIGGFLENFCSYCGAKMESEDQNDI